MSERLLLLLMELFAIAGRGSEEDEKARRKMEEEFLNFTLSAEKAKTFLDFYDSCIKEYHSDDADKNAAIIRSNRIAAISTDLNEGLTQKQKLVVIVRLIEYVFVAAQVEKTELSFLNTIYHTLKIPEEEFKLMLNLIAYRTQFGGENSLVIKGTLDDNNPNKLAICKGLVGEIHIAFSASAAMYFARYHGTQSLQLNGANFESRQVQIFSPGTIIKGGEIDAIYYTEVEKLFLQSSDAQNVEFKVKDITYHFPNNKIGLHELSFTENGGRLIGIMGGSGAGKSTLLNILNGNAKPSSGQVTINGTDLHLRKKELEGVIGFVSQSDLLMEELTVYQNLYFNAQLCFDQKNAAFIQRKVVQVLKDLGLFEARDLKVGNPLEKIISGGQRKRLNIALELIREPGVLFLDEPTSGLSSSDSEVILDLLKTLALKGKLVFVVIHQPSSQIFKLFDKLLILDKGGYPVYQGNPVDAITYFKTATHRINPDISQCVCCGNVNPEQIFTILEARTLNEKGFPSGDRRMSPKQWNEYYLEHTTFESAEEKEVSSFTSDYKKPSYLTQFGVFIKRDVLSKLNNKQYMLITLLEAPVLAVLLSMLTLYQKPGMEYSFQSNRNIVAYIFMSVIVMLFLGLMTSAEEILHDRKIRQRERFLNLSKLAYLKSKISILLVISALQSFLFVMIGNSILEFQEMYLEFWLMLFAVSLFANALGLNISSAFKSAVTIYILIPFLIIPQLMMSGLLVKFDELHPKLASRSVVPLAGEVMATRWAFEGLAVNLFVNNSYKKPLYELEKKKENLVYLSNYWVQEMLSTLVAYEAVENKDSCQALIQVELIKHGQDPENASRESIESGKTEKLLLSLKTKFRSEYSDVVDELDKAYADAVKMTNDPGIWSKRRSLYANDRVEELVLNQDNLGEGIYEEFGQFHPAQNAVYIDPLNNRQLRSHFYAPTKHIFGSYYPTFWVNLFMIIIMTYGLYIALYFELLERLVKWMSRFGGN